MRWRAAGSAWAATGSGMGMRGGGGESGQRNLRLETAIDFAFVMKPRPFPGQKTDVFWLL